MGSIGMMTFHVSIKAAWAWGARVLWGGPLPYWLEEEDWFVLRSL